MNETIKIVIDEARRIATPSKRGQVKMFSFTSAQLTNLIVYAAEQFRGEVVITGSLEPAPVKPIFYAPGKQLAENRAAKHHLINYFHQAKIDKAEVLAGMGYRDIPILFSYEEIENGILNVYPPLKPK